MRRIFNLFGLSLVIILFTGCNKKDISLPEVITAEVVNITKYQATAWGKIISDGNSDISARGICWSYSDNPSKYGTIISVGTGSGSFSCLITGLAAGRTCYVQAYATNSAGTQYGEVVSFITSVSAPEIKDVSSAMVATTSASLRGFVNPMSLLTRITFEYGTTTAYENSISSVPDSLEVSGFYYVNAGLLNLHPGTIYHFRIKAENKIGITCSSDQTFTTPGWPPTVKNEILSDILMNSITVNAAITTGSLITSVIIEYGTSENLGSSVSYTTISEGDWPLLDVKKVFDNLTPGTRYYFRVRVENPVATIYSSVISGTTFNMTDIDQNLYHSIQIGSQTWMQENLRTLHFQNGDPIPPMPYSNDWINATTIACSYYDYDLDLGKKYGFLYNYFVAVDSRNVCPQGWHVPSQAEWTTLVNFAGGESVAAPKLRIPGISNWNSLYYTESDNSTGFTALGAGIRLNTGDYWGRDYNASFWTTDTWPSDPKFVINMRIFENQPNIDFPPQHKNAGLSIRCLKN